MIRYTDTQTWYVIFDKCRGEHWICRWLHKDFQHIILARESAGGTLAINPMVHVTAVQEYPNSIVDFINQEAMQGATAILQYTVHYHSHYRPSFIDLHTCVSEAKRILGIRSRLLTPKALYHELAKAGAIPIKPWCVF